MKKEIIELNAPAIDLIAGILDKHVDAILGEVRIRFKQIKTDQSSEGRAAPQSQPQETIAYVTRNEEGDPAMLFFDLNEAKLYCEPGEEPEALVLAGPARRIEESK